MEEKKTEVLYCNLFSVTISPFDFVFDFGYKTPEQAKSGSAGYEIVARIAMSPQHAKSMLPLLEEMIREYENKVGDIIVRHDSTQDVSARVVASGNGGPMEMPHVSELSREERIKIARSAFGMWADRQDLGDTADYVARLRASWERVAERSGVD